MNLARNISMAAVAAAMIGGTLVAPASAQSQGGGNNQGNTGCTTTGGGAPRGQTNINQQGGPQAIIANVLGLALQNLAVGATAPINVSGLQVVCLNDVLNQNQLQVLNNVLNNNVVTALNNVFVNVNALSLLSGAQVVAADNNNVYVLRR
jgi:hypothetical protein